MEIELTVELLIPDTTALTAFHTLKKIGFKELKKLRREDYYKFTVKNDDFKKVSEKLGKTDILVNANKHRFMTKLSDESFDGEGVKVLVQDIDNKDGMLETLRNRLGLKEIESMERGVLWTLDLEKKELAKEIAESLLFNKHYQEYKILDGKTTYKDAGVNIDESENAVNKLKVHAKKTFNENVMLDIGAFAGAINVDKLKQFKNPILLSSIDGVGTKVMVASMMNKWDSIGKDIIGHAVNDILAVGGEPFFFLNYLATSKVDSDKIEQIIKGMSEAAIENDTPMIAGEIAEMPGVYKKGEHDIVGCIIGIVDRDMVIDGSKIQEGNVLIGLESDGLHTNGFSLVRKVLFEMAEYSVKDKPKELDTSIGEELLRPHKSYVKPVLEVLKQFKVHGIAHITGGGLPDNVGRLLPDGLGVKIDKTKINTQPIFKLIQEKGNVPEDDMFRTFNMGVGMVLIVSKKICQDVLKELKRLKQKSIVIGEVIKGSGVKII
ncbi:MAG: phosphoribosylformylglycinamidine cyclo-ligase [Candidatus Aenigmarchaeota archaeon]|nr:phosphoribosylformylglycinamidine cyclo-ligase [Candidatus Aenigmarchaeota archaeon]